MYEHHKQPLVPRSVFVRRVALSTCAALVMILVSLAAGMIGYHSLEDLAWIDAYNEAAMILSGMGPVAPLHTTLGKFFAGTYALYSGLMLIITVGVMTAPIAHRFFHKLHLDVDDKTR